MISDYKMLDDGTILLSGNYVYLNL